VSAPRRARRGFSLFEVVVAIAVGLALVGVLFTAAFGTWDGRERLTESLDAERSLALVFDRVDRALLVASAQGPARVGGDATMLEIAHRAVRAGAGRGAGRLAADCVLRVSFDERTGRLSIELEGGPEETLPGVHRRVRFRYFDGSDWRDAFGGDGLPHAIEIAAWRGRPDVDEDALRDQDEGAPDDGRAVDEWPFTDEDEPFLVDPADEDETPPDRLRVVAVTDPAPPVEDDVPFSREAGEDPDDGEGDG